MKSDWNDRARDNARYYIASSDDLSDEGFDESGRRDVEAFFKGIEHLLTKDTLVLDIGCGIGRMDKHVAPQVAHLTGVDVSSEMVAPATKRLAALPNVSFLEGDGASLPVEAGSIDLIFSHIVFQHMPRKFSKSYFADAFRALAPGGAFVFQMPESGEHTPVDPPEEDTWTMRFWSEDELRGLLETFGFEFVGAGRHPVDSPHLKFNQLRIHVQKPTSA